MGDDWDEPVEPGNAAHQARMAKYGSSIVPALVREICERIADYPEIVEAVRGMEGGRVASPVVEYGVTFVGGVRDGETIGPLGVDKLGRWFTDWWLTARLVTRVRWTYDEPEGWALATDEQVDHWNQHVMAPHVLGKEGP